MAKVINYFFHPGQRFSQTSMAMAKAAKDVEGFAFVGLYAENPHNAVAAMCEELRDNTAAGDP